MALKHFKSEEKLQFLQVNLTVLCFKPICNNFQLGEKKKKKQSQSPQTTQKALFKNIILSFLKKLLCYWQRLEIA